MKCYDGPSNNGFLNDQAGHILDVGQTLMLKHQMYRFKLLLFLSNSIEFQFFEMFVKNGSIIKCNRSNVYHGVLWWQVISIRIC